MLTPSTSLIDELPIFVQVFSALRDGQSVLFSIPRYCNAPEILSRIRDRFESDIGIRCVFLDARVLTGKGTLDYQELWGAVRRALSPKYSPTLLKPNDIAAFERVLKLSLKQHPEPVLFLVPSLCVAVAKNTFTNCYKCSTMCW